MCGNMRQFAQLDPSWQITKGIAGEKAANKLVDPGGFLGIQDQMDARVSAEKQAARRKTQAAAAETAYTSGVRTLAPKAPTQPTTGRTILGG